MSTRCRGRASRNAMVGTRLWPPASTRPSSSAYSASASVRRRSGRGTGTGRASFGAFIALADPAPAHSRASGNQGCAQRAIREPPVRCSGSPLADERWNDSMQHALQARALERFVANVGVDDPAEIVGLRQIAGLDQLLLQPIELVHVDRHRRIDARSSDWRPR